MEKKITKQLALPLSFRNVKNHSNFILNKVNEVALSLIDEFNDINNFYYWTITRELFFNT